MSQNFLFFIIPVQLEKPPHKIHPISQQFSTQKKNNKNFFSHKLQIQKRAGKNLATCIKGIGII